jgi:hypothetical protein
MVASASAETKHRPLFFFAGKRRVVAGKIIPLPFPASPAVTCYRCLFKGTDLLHLRLHRLQCPRLAPRQRDASAAALARDLGFICTRWPKGTPMAALLATGGHKEAQAAGYETVAEWLHRDIFPNCFRSAIAEIEKPTRQRYGPKWLKDERGRFVKIAPIALPLPRLMWWLEKETKGRAEPILFDLLQAYALPKRLPATLPDGSVKNRRSVVHDDPVAAEAQRKALLHELYRLCDPDAGGPLRPRERRLLRELLGDAPTPLVEGVVNFPSRGALYTAVYRLKAKLPEDLRAALSRVRQRRAAPA